MFIHISFTYLSDISNKAEYDTSIFFMSTAHTRIHFVPLRFTIFVPASWFQLVISLVDEVDLIVLTSLRRIDVLQIKVIFGDFVIRRYNVMCVKREYGNIPVKLPQFMLCLQGTFFDCSLQSYIQYLSASDSAEVARNIRYHSISTNRNSTFSNR